MYPLIIWKNMDRLEAMSLLIAAAEAGSLSGAGRRLGVPLPTVSRKIAELEAHLDARLLVRTTRKLALTDAGEAYVAAARRILDAVGDAERAAAGEFSAPKGELNITAPVLFGRLHVLPAVNDFLSEHPAIDVRLMLSDRNQHLIDDHIDMAVRIGALADSALIATRVGSLRRVVVGTPDYFAAHGEPASPDDLAAHTCVNFDAPGAPAMWNFRGAQKAVQMRARLSVNTAEAAIDAALAGVGVTRVLSYQAARAVREGKLRVVLEAFESEPIPVHFVHAAQGQLPRKMRSFLDFAVPRVRAALKEIEQQIDGRQ
jgi:DNA-binding transcriptional LysR family regulator